MRKLFLEQLETRMVPSGIPLLSSRPGAPATIYLNFGGDFVSWWYGYQNISIPAYDTDGNLSVVSTAEANQIAQVWQIVAENYSVFNLNVTTVKPSGTQPEVSQIDIGGDGAWIGYPGGVAVVGGIPLSATNGNNPLRGFVFPKNLGTPWNIGEATSHESGHTMGLYHHSSWVGATETTEYYSGPGDGTAPIMGGSYNSQRGMWWYGTNDLGPTFYQSDLQVIANNGFGFRPSSTGSSIYSAHSLVGSSASGVLESMTQKDFWSFSTNTGSAYIQVNAPQFGNLHPKFEIQDARGNVVVPWVDTDSSSVFWTGRLHTGTYYLVVSSHGPSRLSTSNNYGFDVGSYNVVVALSSPSRAAAPIGNGRAAPVENLGSDEAPVQSQVILVERQGDHNAETDYASAVSNKAGYHFSKQSVDSIFSEWRISL